MWTCLVFFFLFPFGSTLLRYHQARVSHFRYILASGFPVPIQSVIFHLWQEGEHTALRVPTPTYF